MAKSDAPNYGPSQVEGETCNNCKFGGNGFCELWNFDYDQGFRCDNWRPMPATTRKGIIITLIPDLVSALALVQEDGEPIEDLHLTLVALGKMGEVDFTKDEVLQALDTFCNGRSPISGVVNGHGVFENDDEVAYWATFDSPELPGFREELVNALSQASIPIAMDHGFTPHITLAYAETDEENNEREEIELGEIFIQFNDVYLMWGEERISFPLVDRAERIRTLMPWKTRSGLWAIS